MISADGDFATVLALSSGAAPSLVLSRSSDRLAPPAHVALLLTKLPTLDDEPKAGVVVSLRTVHVRVRRPPLNG